jgi:O-antigen/teichoic acid export membrane protein
MSEGAPSESVARGAANRTSLPALASRSVLWVGLGKASNALIQIGVTAVLARLLSASDFGVIAMVVVLSGFLNILAEAGMSTTVVQKRELDRDSLSSLFWLGLGVASVTAAALALCSPWVAKLFGEPRLTPVVAWMSLGLVFLSLGRVPNGLLQRAFKFRELAFIEASAAVGSGVVGVWLGLTGLGYFALVAQTLVSGLLNAGLRLAFSGFRPRLHFDYSKIKSATGYSGNVTAFAAINYWARNLDKALIGRSLGAAELGFYGRAYALMLHPLEAIGGVINPSLHPILSALQGDPERMTRAYIKVARLVALLALPSMCILGAMAPELVRTVWGPNWEPSIRVFSILCLVGSVQPIGSTFGAVFLATNKTRLLAIVGAVNAVVIMAGIAIGVPFGIDGAAIGYSLGYSAIFFPTMYVVLRVLLRGSALDMVKILAPALLVAAPVMGALYGFNRLLRGQWGDLPHLLAGLLLGVVVWLLAFALVDRPLFLEARSLLPNPFKPKTPRS